MYAHIMRNSCITRFIQTSKDSCELYLNFIIIFGTQNGHPCHPDTFDPGELQITTTKVYIHFLKSFVFQRFSLVLQKVTLFLKQRWIKLPRGCRCKIGNKNFKQVIDQKLWKFEL